MTRMMSWLHERECTVFHWVNHKWQHQILNKYFAVITHLGGATLSISVCLFIMIMSSGNLRSAAFQSLLALAVSHIPVQVSKKLYPRKRPYQVLPGTVTISRLLKDHSFPSGHTTAIFSVITPLALLDLLSGIILLPIACSVAISRIYLGLHYPSDVLAGILLGIGSGLLTCTLPIMI